MNGGMSRRVLQRTASRLLKRTGLLQRQCTAAMATHLLTCDNMNPYIKTMQYAVRGPLVIRAVQLEKELKQVTYYIITDGFLIRLSIRWCLAGCKTCLVLEEIFAICTIEKYCRGPRNHLKALLRQILEMHTQWVNSRLRSFDR